MLDPARQKPVNALVAIGFALSLLPALKLLDYLNRGCGDGLCGFFSGLLVVGGLLIATIVFVVRSARRNEAPALLRLVPLPLWLLGFVPLFF